MPMRAGFPFRASACRRQNDSPVKFRARTWQHNHRLVNTVCGFGDLGAMNMNGGMSAIATEQVGRNRPMSGELPIAGNFGRVHQHFAPDGDAHR